MSVSIDCLLSSLPSSLIRLAAANIVTFGADWLAIKTHTHTVSQSARVLATGKKLGERKEDRKKETSKGAKIEQTKRVHTNRTCKGHQSGWQTESQQSSKQVCQSQEQGYRAITANCHHHQEANVSLLVSVVLWKTSTVREGWREENWG